MARTSPPYFTRSDQAGLEQGYYWIQRAEPDGPPFWEVARFCGRWWHLTGTPYKALPTRDINASNAWQLGPRVDPPADRAQ